MNKIKLLVLIALIISLNGSISAQSQVLKPIDVAITSLMQMRMRGNPDARFELPANSKYRTREESGALQIDVQSNRDWMLQVRALNLSDPSNTETMPLGSLRIRADGKSFMTLDQKEINLVKGSKGSFNSAGHSLSVDYEFTFKNNQNVNNYEFHLLYTLVAI